MTNKRVLLRTLGAGFAFVLAVIILSTRVPFAQSIRIVGGSVLLLLAPGLPWTFVFWPSGSLRPIERATMSLVLSMALLPLTIYLSTLFGVRVNASTVAVTTLGLMVLGVLVFSIARRHPA